MIDGLTVRRAIELREEAEKKIRDALQRLVDETGLIPTRINFDALDVTRLSQGSAYLVQKVTIRVEL